MLRLWQSTTSIRYIHTHEEWTLHDCHPSWDHLDRLLSEPVLVISFCHLLNPCFPASWLSPSFDVHPPKASWEHGRWEMQCYRSASWKCPYSLTWLMEKRNNKLQIKRLFPSEYWWPCSKAFQRQLLLGSELSPPWMLFIPFQSSGTGSWCRALSRYRVGLVIQNLCPLDLEGFLVPFFIRSSPLHIPSPSLEPL